MDTAPARILHQVGYVMAQPGLIMAKMGLCCVQICPRMRAFMLQDLWLGQIT